MTKRTVLTALIICFIFIACMIWLSHSPVEESPEKIEEERTVDVENMGMLSPYLEAQKADEMTDRIADFLSGDETYHLNCNGAIDGENKLEFYFTISELENTILYGKYEKNSGDFLFWTEQQTIEEAAQKWTEKEQQHDESYLPDGELPSEWNYVDTEVIPIHLTGKDFLEDMFSAEELAALENQLLIFLEENNEYRRELSIEEDSVTNLEDSISMRVVFLTPRIDRKGIDIVYDKGTEDWQFTLCDE